MVFHPIHKSDLLYSLEFPGSVDSLNALREGRAKRSPGRAGQHGLADCANDLQTGVRYSQQAHAAFRVFARPGPRTAISNFSYKGIFCLFITFSLTSDKESSMENEETIEVHELLSQETEKEYDL